MNHEWAKKYYCNGRTFHFQESRCSQQMKLPVLNAFIRAWELYYRWYRTGYEVVGIEDERKLLLDPPSPHPSHVPVEGIWGNVWQVMLSMEGRAVAVMQSCRAGDCSNAAYICCMIFIIRRWPQARCNSVKCASTVCYTELSQRYKW